VAVKSTSTSCRQGVVLRFRCRRTQLSCKSPKSHQSTDGDTSDQQKIHAQCLKHPQACPLWWEGPRDFVSPQVPAFTAAHDHKFKLLWTQVAANTLCATALVQLEFQSKATREEQTIAHVLCWVSYKQAVYIGPGMCAVLYTTGHIHGMGGGASSDPTPMQL
jgi:hypothetical protein